MAIFGKNPESGPIDLPAVANEEAAPVEAEYSLAEVAIDAGTVDVTPATSVVTIATPEAPILEPAPSESSENSAVFARANYSRRDSLRGEVLTSQSQQPCSLPTACLTRARATDLRLRVVFAASFILQASSRSTWVTRPKFANAKL